MIKEIIKEGTWFEKIVLVECEFCHEQRQIPYSTAIKKEAMINKHRCRSCATTQLLTGRKYSEEHKKNIRTSLRKINNGGIRYNQGRGYKQVIVDDYHPRKKDRKGGNYIFEHILIMEKQLGRFLEKHEIVHHIDKNKQNNNIENLYLFSGKDNKESSQMHNAAHESLEEISIELFKLGLIDFKNGKYQISEQLKQYMLFIKMNPSLNNKFNLPACDCHGI
jgi:hypothetical protein